MVQRGKRLLPQARLSLEVALQRRPGDEAVGDGQVTLPEEQLGALDLNLGRGEEKWGKS